MTPDEVIDLLTTAAAYDRRKVGKADVMAWHAAVKDLDFLDAQNAVIAHYTLSTDWLMPAHVRAGVKQIRTARLAIHAVPAPPPELTDEPGIYQQAVQELVAKLASGYVPPKEITAGADPSEVFVTLRGADHDPVRAAALLVPCPWPACKAMPGAVCVDADKRRLAGPAHEARLKVAGLVRDAP